jgi:hypothetical protein
MAGKVASALADVSLNVDFRPGAREAGYLESMTGQQSR